MEISLQNNQMFDEYKQSKLWGKGSGSSGVLNLQCLDQTQFVPLKTNICVQDISIASSFMLMLSTKGELFVWGLLQTQKIPKPISILLDVKKISCGWQHALITTSNRMFGFGSNASQQLGFASFEKYHHKLVEIILEQVQFIAAGFRQSYIILQNSLRGCGQSKKNQLGEASKKTLLWTTLYENLDMIEGKIVHMACGKRFLLILSDQKQVYGFGCNEQNCFNQKVSYFDKPTKIFSGVRQFVCGWAHITLLKQDGSVESYGRNNLGQLGHGKETNKIMFQLQEGQKIDKLTSGSEFTFAVTTKSRLYSWGWNEHFNLISSEEKILASPTLVAIPQKCSQIWTNPALTIIKTFIQQ